MYTIIETPLFQADRRAIWGDDELGDFCAWLALHPEAGDVIPGSGGCRKVVGHAPEWASAAARG